MWQTISVLKVMSCQNSTSSELIANYDESCIHMALCFVVNSILLEVPYLNCVLTNDFFHI